MQSTTFKLPVDFQESFLFRRLLASLCPGNPREAVYIWVTVWRDLSYRAMEGGSPGRLNKSQDLPFFYQSFSQSAIPPEQIFQKLEECSFFVKVDGTDDLVCPLFASTNSDAALQHRSQAQMGGNIKAFNARVRSASNLDFQAQLGIEAEWKDPGGAAIDAATVQRIQKFVLIADGALFKAERPAWSWNTALVHNALEVVTRYSDAELHQLLLLIAKKRGHALLEGMTTEKLLPVISEIAGKLG